MVTVVAIALMCGGLAIFGRQMGVAEQISRVVREWQTRRLDARSQLDLVDAVASWTENLRDLLAASSGIEQAIISTQDHAPRRIEDEVRQLAADLRYRPMDEALRAFAESINHPTCDFVVLALLSTVQNPTKDLVQLLSQLADCARSECDLYLRVWVSRARTRTAVRIIFGSVAVFVAGLILFNPSYVAPFLTQDGLVFLAVMVAMFSGALVWIARISQVPERGRLIAKVAGS